MPCVNIRLTTVLCAAGLLAVGGCGNKGPLYLPRPESGSETGQSASPPEASRPEQDSGDTAD